MEMRNFLSRIINVINFKLGGINESVCAMDSIVRSLFEQLIMRLSEMFSKTLWTQTTWNHLSYVYIFCSRLIRMDLDK